MSTEKSKIIPIITLVEGTDFTDRDDAFRSIQARLGEISLPGSKLIFTGYDAADNSGDTNLSRRETFGVTEPEFEESIKFGDLGANPLAHAGVGRPTSMLPTIAIYEASGLENTGTPNQYRAAPWIDDLESLKVAEISIQPTKR